MASNFSIILLNFICLDENVTRFVFITMEFLYITIRVKPALRGSETIQATIQKNDSQVLYCYKAPLCHNEFRGLLFAFVM